MTRTRSNRRTGRPGLAVLAAACLTGAVIVSDADVGGSATPPAELASVLTVVGDSFQPSISGDGAAVAFTLSENFGEGAVHSAKFRDRVGQQTLPVPFAFFEFDEQLGVVISRDGCQLAYRTSAALTDGEGTYTGEVVVVSDRCSGARPKAVYQQSRTQRLGQFLELSISAHGRYIAFDDTSNGTVVWLDRDVEQNGVLDDSPVRSSTSVAPASAPSLGDETMTNKVAITAEIRPLLAQVYLWDPTRSNSDPAALTLVSAADGAMTPIDGVTAREPSMTPDGRYVAFSAFSTNEGDPTFNNNQQVLARDVATNRTALVSRSAAGVGGTGGSVQPSISADGTQIAFGTTATDLLDPGIGGTFTDGGGSFDLLVARSTSDLFGELFGALAFDRVSLKPNGDPIDPKNASMDMEHPVISSSGRWVAFESTYGADLGDPGPNTTPEFPVLEQAYVMGRPTTVTITPLDFGDVQVGNTSPARIATVANTGVSSILPASIADNSADFAIVAGGTCAVDVWLSPGQSCTIAVTFTPAAPAAASRALTVAESGFAAITATGSLRGAGTAVPPTTTTTPTTSPTTTTTSTTTTVPTPTTTSTTTTTVPRSPRLAITPEVGSFGSATVGVGESSTVFTVTSTGTSPADIAEVSISGANAADFAITANDCANAALEPGTSCAVTVSFAPSTTGSLVATLTAGSLAAAAVAQLEGTGLAQPTLRLLPNVVALRDLTVAVGAGFAPDLGVQLQWMDSSVVFEGTTDSAGNLRVRIPVRTNELPGRRTLVAVDQPFSFSGVNATALVVEESAQPPTTRNPALAELSILVIRG